MRMCTHPNPVGGRCEEMASAQPGPDAMERVLKETLQALHAGRDRLVDINQTARTEYDRLKANLDALKKQVLACVEEVDELETQMRRARLRLYEVSRNFQTYSESEVRDAYLDASQVQERLSAAREREKALRLRRDELELSLQNLCQMVEKAEAFHVQMNAAIGVLAGNLESMTAQLAGLHQKSVIGRKVIRAQEEERRRVAREIHDGPAQTLANVVLRTEITDRLLSKGDLEGTQKELAQLRELIKDSVADLRRIIFDLRPMALDDLGLAPTLRRYLENMKERASVPVEFLVFGAERRAEPAVEVAMFRLIQEAVGNAARHAKPRRIVVRLEFTPQLVRVSVEDDGVGFDTAAAMSRSADRGSFGLLGMRERIELLDGEWGVHSVPGKGTRVTAALSLRDETDPVLARAGGGTVSKGLAAR